MKPCCLHGLAGPLSPAHESNCSRFSYWIALDTAIYVLNDIMFSVAWHLSNFDSGSDFLKIRVEC